MILLYVCHGDTGFVSVTCQVDLNKLKTDTETWVFIIVVKHILWRSNCGALM